MSWRGVVIYWVLALAVGAQLAWTLAARERPADAAPEPTAPVISATGPPIDVLRAERGMDALEFRKTSGRWTTDGTGGEVSSDLLAALIDTLTTVPPVEVLTEGSGQLASYGLEPPQMVVRMGSGETPVATLELGTRNPTRTAVYARRPDLDRVYLLGLNAQYYLDLIFEQAAGAPAPLAD